MEKLALPLKPVILDEEITSAQILKAVIESKPDIQGVKVTAQTIDADVAFQTEGYNSLFIDIFSLGVEKGLQYIEHVREKYDFVPICLYSTAAALQTMPGVSNSWRKRFGHYFKLAKDQMVNSLETAAEGVLYDLSYELQAGIVRNKLSNLRAMLEKDEQQHFASDEKREIIATAVAAERVLESQRKNVRTATPIPGIDTDRLESLVSATLKEATESLRLTARVNIGVLIAGAALVLGSVIFAAITRRWEAVAFGGFGMAGVIASLITSPLKSIGASARRLVQVQVAYFSFLSQLEILNRDHEGTTQIDKVKLLGEQMQFTIKALKEYSGE